MKRMKPFTVVRPVGKKTAASCKKSCRLSLRYLNYTSVIPKTALLQEQEYHPAYCC